MLPSWLGNAGGVQPVAQWYCAPSKGKKIMIDTVSGVPSPLSVTVQMLCVAFGLIGRGIPLMTTLVSCPAILVVLPTVLMQITSPWNSCTAPVADVSVMSYCPFAANGVRGSVRSATKEYSSVTRFRNGGLKLNAA